MSPSLPSHPGAAPASAPIPTGPRGHLLLGVLPAIRRDALQFLMSVSREYGDVARYRMATIISHLVSHPDGVKHVLQDNVKNYTKDHFSYGLLRRLAGNGLLTSQGSFWLRQRRLAQPAFHRQRIAALGAVMTSATLALCEQWQSADAGQPREIGEAMMRLTLQIVGEALFGTSVTAQTRSVSHAFHILSDQLVTRFRTFNLLPPVLPTAYDRQWRAALRELDTVVYQIIATRRQRGEDTGDLLSMLMLTRDEETGEQMDDRQLRDEVLTMLIAGHETTATTLTWVWALLAQHPAVEARLWAELDTVLGGRTPTIDDLPQLAYTRMVIEEAMRLYPPIYIVSRSVVADDVIGGYRIRAGTSVDISPYVTHRHPAFWERPDHFDPDRFAPERVAARPRFAYFPFSGGPRQCIGNSFAMIEAQLILATIAQRYRLTLPPGHAIVPEPLITLRPKGGLPMLITTRPAQSQFGV